MATAQLPVSGLINSVINLASAPAQAQSLSQELVLGPSDVIDTTERQRLYDSLTAVATDFGNTAPEYLAAQAWFDQSPQPPSVLIGRWAKTATSARLQGGVVSPANQVISVWTAITAGGIQITVNGTVQNSPAIDFASVTNLNGVASAIQAALTGVTVTWDASYQTFLIKTVATGSTETISFAQASTTAGTTDISGMLVMQSTSSGAYVVDGIAAESALSAVTLFDANYGQQWYGLFVATAVDSDHLAIAAYIEGSSNRYLYGVSTQESGVLVGTDTTDIAYQLSQLAYRHTLVQYSSTSAYAVLSMMARILTTNMSAVNTMISLMYKQEPGIVAESINPTQLASLIAKNCNIFVDYDNSTSILQPGVCCSGDFIDTIYGCDWLSITLQNALFNVLYTSPTKIPQRDKGAHILVVTAESILQGAVVDLGNGLLAPGTWTQAGFGALNEGDYLPKGFYVYVQPMALQNPTDRAARKAPPLQIAAKLSGAIQTVDILINVNR